ncbi:glycosyltransferase family 2 protein [Mucilaginibacter aquaedulcis]|uniref:glycosyltransferase family 2 protein n=1 Tax=Mucilaginibacter aquaedulcis TaxID=1187081 RepID=UPI0025B303DA|nr:glycosyltransferase family 2 protein [Mucilaginibacter aquaedulcis]MDN3548735.1 glycosyltransferase family 2 protein [Mucilaginibacter aquaedulcis]
MPTISVIMPVYNTEDYLKEAIDSILAQSFGDFEFLIFNDGSSDNSREIVLSYTDQRIRFFDDNINLGYTRRLNQGLALASGKYIARMDADDIALPARFELQYAFMEKNPDITVCGTFFNFTGADGQLRNFNWVSEADPDRIKINLLFDCAICHPTVILRKNHLRTHKIQYKVDYEPSEDYEMWISLSRELKLANIPERLLHYRISKNQVSGKHNEKQRHNKLEFIQEQLLLLNIAPLPFELRIHDQMFYPMIIISYDYLPKIKQWVSKLIAANEIHQVYHQEKFVEYLRELVVLNEEAFQRALSQSNYRTRLLLRLKILIRWNSIN